MQKSHVGLQVLHVIKMLFNILITVKSNLFLFKKESTVTFSYIFNKLIILYL